MKLLNYIFKKMYMFSWQTREEYIYIYIYIERERERESSFSGSEKRHTMWCVGTKKHTHAHYMNSVMYTNNCCICPMTKTTH